MHPLPKPADHDDGRLATLTEEVSQLRDLFQRRLLEDKAKNRLYEELHDQLALARGGLADQLLAPLFREVLLIVDRVSNLNQDDDVILESIVDELLELLARRDVRRVPSLNNFDPAYHEAVRIETDRGYSPGSIIEILRPGYLMGQQLLRPERVVVAADNPPGAGEGSPRSTEGCEVS